jgi:hypothetical protein
VDWIEIVQARVTPAGSAAVLSQAALAIALGVAVAASVVRPVWRVLRLAVTLVHELGHAIVGMAVGRRFTGFVLRGDMSGHAVTVGRARGPGRVLSTWAGYPAPAVIGAGMVWLAGRGWAAPFVTGVLVILLLALVRVRSALTVLVMVVVLAGTTGLWWWRDDALQAQVLVGLGILLVAGAWRHLAAVFADRSQGSDPGVLAALTRVPRAIWNASFALVCAAATWLVVVEVWGLVRA